LGENFPKSGKNLEGRPVQKLTLPPILKIFRFSPYGFTRDPGKRVPREGQVLISPSLANTDYFLKID
jgi:hypothetical protein